MADEVGPVTTKSNAGTEEAEYHVRIVVMAWARTKHGSKLVDATVTKLKGVFGKGPWLPATVNWSAMGATDPVLALATSKVLAVAYKMAKRLDEGMF
jgi:hypothetical protein